jgi:hypothetical protein
MFSTDVKRVLYENVFLIILLPLLWRREKKRHKNVTRFVCINKGKEMRKRSIINILFAGLQKYTKQMVSSSCILLVQALLRYDAPLFLN